MTRVSGNKAETETYYSLSEVLDLFWQVQHTAEDLQQRRLDHLPEGTDPEKDPEALAYEDMAERIKEAAHRLHR
jgi:hypothetical protein